VKNLVPVLALFALLTANASSQERRLSEVAGDIRLHSPEGEAVLVDLVPAPAPGSAPATEGNDLLELSELLGQHAATVNGLLDEVRYDGMFYDDTWRRSMTDACSDLGTVSRLLLATPPSPRYSDAYSTLVDASRESIGAAETIERAIEMDRPVYGSAFDQIVAARRLAGEGAGDVRRVWETEIDEAEAPPDDPVIVRQNIVSGCDRVAVDRRAYDDCVTEQEDAISSLSLRFSSTVLLDEAQFNTIRNQCRREWPADYAARDRCERMHFAMQRR